MKRNLLFYIACLLVVASYGKSEIQRTVLNDSICYDILVAKDGSGDYTRVQEAVNAVPNNSSERTIIFIKQGIYKEKIVVPMEKSKVTFIGESYENTILTYDDHAKINSDYASTKILAEDFYAENITFQNTIDSRKGGSQAAALRVDADKAIFYKCKITGFQDTFYLKSNTRSYVKDCIIDGTVDFIYGAGIVLFENCTIRNRANSHITASSQKIGESNFGFVFNNCSIIKHPDEDVSRATLGRPWGNGANTVYLNCTIGNHVKPEGFAPWSTEPAHRYYHNIDTAYYGIYGGSGYKIESLLSVVHVLDDTLAAKYIKANIFAANSTIANKLNGNWNPKIENSIINPVLFKSNSKKSND